MADRWAMLESELLTRIIYKIGDRPGLLFFHEWDSRKDQSSGFPDMVIVGSRGILFRELKTLRGQLSRTQVNWKWSLLAAGADYAIWTPDSVLSGQVDRELDMIS